MASKKIIAGQLQFVLVLVGCIAATPAAHAQSKWVRLAPFPEPAEEILGAAAGGKIYAFGGFVFRRSGRAVCVPINNDWQFVPATDNWKALASLPTKRGSAVAA